MNSPVPIMTYDIIEQLKKLLSIVQNESPEKLKNAAKKIEFPLLKDICYALACYPKEIVEALIIQKRIQVYHAYANLEIEDDQYDFACLSMLFACFALNSGNIEEFDLACNIFLASLKISGADNYILQQEYIKKY